MKTNYILLLFCLLSFGCYKESALTADDDPNSLVLRYDFPQGNNSWDMLAVEIAENYSTYPIYKNLKNEDFNRSWLNLGGGSETSMFGKSLQNDAQAEWSMNFLSNLLDMFSKKVLDKILPTYIYLAYDVYQYRYDDYWETENYDPIQKILDGPDYWSFCFETETPEFALTQPVTEDEVYQLRGAFVLDLTMTVIQMKNKLEIPNEFYTDFDYITELGEEDSSENYGNRRGFLGSLYEFIPSWYDTMVWSVPTAEDNFYNYVLHLIAFDRDQFLSYYGNFPKTIQYYDFVKEYLLKTYDWDIQKVRKRDNLNN